MHHVCSIKSSRYLQSTMVIMFLVFAKEILKHSNILLLVNELQKCIIILMLDFWNLKCTRVTLLPVKTNSNTNNKL